jgi:hypothetical protein
MSGVEAARLINDHGVHIIFDIHVYRRHGPH